MSSENVRVENQMIVVLGVTPAVLLLEASLSVYSGYELSPTCLVMMAIWGALTLLFAKSLIRRTADAEGFLGDTLKSIDGLQVEVDRFKALVPEAKASEQENVDKIIALLREGRGSKGSSCEN